MQGAGVQVNDGVAMIFRGDTMLMLWNAPARLHRSRWAYDRIDEFAATRSDGILSLMIVLSTAHIPDRATRVENSVRLKKLAPLSRRLVTVVQGDEFHHTVARSVLRLMALPLGSKGLVVASSVEGGISRLQEAAGTATPSVAELRRAASSLYAALGLEVPAELRDGRG